MLAAEWCGWLWPEDPLARATARSAACEMHAGFGDLRTFMPMDFTARFSPPGKLLSGVAQDIARITALWRECRERFGEGVRVFGERDCRRIATQRRATLRARSRTGAVSPSACRACCIVRVTARTPSRNNVLSVG